MIYRKTSSKSRTKSQKLSVSCLLFAQSIEARCQVENEDVVGAAPTGDAPTTSELSTILLPFQGATYVKCLTVERNKNWLFMQIFAPELLITKWSKFIQILHLIVNLKLEIWKQFIKWNTT